MDFNLPKALGQVYPEHTFFPWLFNTTRHDFWANVDNRRSYLDWLMEEIGVSHYNELKTKNFIDHSGSGLLIRYGGSVQRVFDSVQDSRESAEGVATAKRGALTRGHKPLRFWVPFHGSRRGCS